MAFTAAEAGHVVSISLSFHQFSSRPTPRRTGGASATYGSAGGCVPGKPGCLQVRSASVPTFYMGSSLTESWTKSRKQVLPQLDNGEG